MVCKHCGTQNPDSSTFCQGCGAKLGGSGTAGSNGAGGNNSYGAKTIETMLFYFDKDITRITSSYNQND